jgi:PiT family inorganic phosphate transporter
MAEIVLALLFGLYLAWCGGANDAAGAMGTSVGSGALRMRKALTVAAALVLAGAVLFGERVIGTIGYRIMPPESIGGVGALSAVLAAALWISFCLKMRTPISTTHSVVGAVVGYGLFTGAAIDRALLARIAESWVATPIITGALAFLGYYSLSKYVFRRVGGMEERNRLEKNFARLQILSAMLVAFSIGANDVSNAVALVNPALVGAGVPPVFVRMMGGMGFVLGVFMWGPRIIRTVAFGLIDFTPSRGFVAQACAGLFVFAATFLSMPVSTTHALIGAVLGVGLARGIGTINRRVAGEILFSWIITVPVSALLSAGIYYAVRGWV